MRELERLIRLARAGDLDAARALWSHARRRSDTELAVCAARTLRVLDLHIALVSELWSHEPLPSALANLCSDLGFYIDAENRSQMNVLRLIPASSARFPLTELMRCLHLASRQRVGLVHNNGRTALAARRDDQISLVIAATSEVRDLMHNAHLFVGPEVVQAGERAVLLDASPNPPELSTVRAERGKAISTPIPRAQLDVVDLSLDDTTKPDAPALHAANSLSLRHVRLGADALANLLAGCGPELHTLDLSHSKAWGLELDLRWIDALCSSPATQRLERLALINVGMRNIHVERLIAGLEGRAHNLEALALSDNLITADGLRALAKSHLAKQLRVLEVSKCGLGPEGGEILADTAWPQLVSLELGRNTLRPEGLVALARADFVSQLLRLALDANDLTGASLEPLLRHERLELRALDLSSNRLGTAGARRLAESAHLGQLELLDLRKTALTQAGWAMLRDSPYHSGTIIGSGSLDAPLRWKSLIPPGATV